MKGIPLFGEESPPLGKRKEGMVFLSSVTLQKQRYQMADFGSTDQLPDLHNVSYVHSTVLWDDSLTENDTRYVRYGRVSSILPYLNQSRYNREKHDVQKDAVILENERVRAEFLPWMGGRMWSLQVDGRELLSRNPVVQSCNLALRNAWCSGGVEWNVSVRGHNLLTCETLFTELLHLKDGTAGVRFYEYERLRGIVYRLEAYLPPQSSFLYVQVHIENPVGNGEVPMYWWSNIAVPEEKGTRIVVPADTAILSLYDAGQYRMLRHKLPVFEGMNLTRPCDITRSFDVFFDLREGEYPFITALQSDHTGLVQCSTARQFGRKLFVWGMGQGGRNWQRFLSDGDTRYLEIQAGIARTQQDHLPMPDGATWKWLEAYGRLTCDVDTLDHTDAVLKCRDALEAALPFEQLNAEHQGRGVEISQAYGELVVYGSGWGALENERRTAEGLEALSAVCRFPDSTIGKEQAPWKQLLQTGRFDDMEPSEFPISYMIAAPWKALLKNVPANAATCYHLAIMEHCQGNSDKARALLDRSLSYYSSAAAHRALARLDYLDGQKEACLKQYHEALQLSGAMPELELEYAQTLLAFGKYGELLAFMDELPQAVRDLPRFLYLRASALTETRRYEDAEEILLRPLVIPDMREGELSLCDLWFHLYMKKENLTRQQVEEKYPLPKELDFRMH